MVPLDATWCRWMPRGAAGCHVVPLDATVSRHRISVFLGPELQTLLRERIASLESSGAGGSWTQSAVIRQALVQFLERTEAGDPEPQPAKKVAKRKPKKKSEPLTLAVVEKPKKPRVVKPKEPTEATKKAVATWTAYNDAYVARYGAEPIRNARVNGQITQLVQRLGADAPYVAEFYLAHSGRWYVQKGHSVAAMVNDAEALHTQWQTGRRTTYGDAVQAEKADEMRNSAERTRDWLEYFRSQKSKGGEK